MDKKTKLKKLLSVLEPDATQVDFAEFDKRVDDLKTQLKEKIQIKTVDDVNSQLDKFKKKIDLSPLQEAMKSIEEGIGTRISTLTEAIEYELNNFDSVVKSQDESSKVSLSTIEGNLEALRAELQSLNNQKDTELADVKAKLSQIDELGSNVNVSFESINAEMEGMGGNHKLMKDEVEDFVNKTNQSIEKLRQELSNRINNIRIGGGNQNRNIAVGGNPSVLSKYTDINLKPGNNVSITYTANNTTKYTDITISATGGGSSVAGTVRSINRVSTSQTMGSVVGTDYVYIADQGVRLTLPDATGITNLYTIKNISPSSVLVSTTAAQTIDTDSELILATQYTAVDLVNDGADDWSIT
jgi:hypothetical protein